MKTWIIALPFLCAASAALAQAQPDAHMPPAEPERAAAQARPAAMTAAPAARDDAATMRESRATEAKVTTKRRAARQGARSLPKGDVRHCLDLKTRAEVIRCSETRQRK